MKGAEASLDTHWPFRRTPRDTLLAPHEWGSKPDAYSAMAFLTSHNSAAHLHDVVAQMEQRASLGVSDAARLEGLVRQLTTTAAAAWPSEARAGLSLGLRLFSLSATLQDQSVRTAVIAPLAELALSRLSIELRSATEEDAELASTLLSLWHRIYVLPRHLSAEVIAESAPCWLLDELSALLTEELIEGTNQKHPVDITASLLRPGTHPTQRDYLLFHARVEAARGNIASVVNGLRGTNVDVSLLGASAEMLADAGQHEQAIQNLKKALVLATDTRAIREQLYERYKDAGQNEEAHAQLFTLLRESGDLLYWNILVHELTDADPARLVALRRQIAEQTPGLHAEIFIHEGDVQGVVTAARAKNFTATELWRIADYLRTRRSGAATPLYLRAITLGGATARTRQECEALGARVERILPFFDEQNAGLRLRRTAKEALARHKKNIPLQREFERVFGPSFRR